MLDSASDRSFSRNPIIVISDAIDLSLFFKDIPAECTIDIIKNAAII